MGYDFGKAIKLLRKERKITQGQLAELSGVKRSTIASYELGTKQPTASKIAFIANAMNVPIGVIYYLAETEVGKEDKPSS